MATAYNTVFVAHFVRTNPAFSWTSQTPKTLYAIGLIKRGEGDEKRKS